MSHRSLFWPITLIIIVAATMGMVITSTSVSQHVVVFAQSCPTDGTNPAYPDCVKTAAAQAATATTEPQRILSGCPTKGPANRPPYPPYDDCMKTRTALLVETERAAALAVPTVPTAGNSSPAQVAPTEPPTVTPTPTPTFTSTAAATSTPLATPTFRAAAHATPTATPAAVVPRTEIAVIPCIPGDVIMIEGSTDPQVSLIVTFGDRPVGGGFTRNDGSYRIRLRIGDERPGIYPVQVQDRATRSVVQELSCQVPAFTPTPTLSLIP
ncbi:MAG: hypothetical protein WCI67_13080 [Chloroflexales bacterium]